MNLWIVVRVIIFRAVHLAVAKKPLRAHSAMTLLESADVCQELLVVLVISVVQDTGTILHQAVFVCIIMH